MLAAAQWLLAVVFVTAGVPKLLSLEDFALAVYNYRLLPSALVGATAVVLPGVEAVAGLALLSRRWRSAAVWIMVGLCGVFTVASATAIARGLNIECGCFGVLIRRKVGYAFLAQNIGLLALALYCAVSTPRLAVAPAPSGPPEHDEKGSRPPVART